MMYWLAGEKYSDLLRKYKGEEMKKRGKIGDFNCTSGKKYHFEKRGWGKNILFWANIHFCSKLQPSLQANMQL